MEAGFIFSGEIAPAPRRSITCRYWKSPNHTFDSKSVVLINDFGHGGHTPAFASLGLGMLIVPGSRMIRSDIVTLVTVKLFS